VRASNTGRQFHGNVENKRKIDVRLLPSEARKKKDRAVGLREKENRAAKGACAGLKRGGEIPKMQKLHKDGGEIDTSASAVTRQGCCSCQRASSCLFAMLNLVGWQHTEEWEGRQNPENSDNK